MNEITENNVPILITVCSTQGGKVRVTNPIIPVFITVNLISGQKSVRLPSGPTCETKNTDKDNGSLFSFSTSNFIFLIDNFIIIIYGQ